MEIDFCCAIQAPSLKSVLLCETVAFAMFCAHSYPRFLNTKMWLHRSSFVSNVVLMTIACLWMCGLLYSVWVSRHPRHRILHFDRCMCMLVAISLVFLPFSDKWRMSRIFNENVFEVYEVDHCDDTVLILCMLSTVIFVSSWTRCSQNWIVQVGGSLSFSLSTILLGAPENDPFSRTRHFRDVLSSCVFTFAVCMTWLGTREREQYTRLHFVGKKQAEDMLAVTRRSLKGYVDSWVIVKRDRILKCSPLFYDVLGFNSEGRKMTDILVEADRPRFESFMQELQRTKDSQKVNIGFKTQAGWIVQVEAFGVYVNDGCTHITFKHQMVSDISSFPGNEGVGQDTACAGEDEFVVADDETSDVVGEHARSEVGSDVSTNTYFKTSL